MEKIIFMEAESGISIERLVRDYEFSMASRHMHDAYEIYYLLEGERYYFIGQQTYLIKKGSLVFIDRGQVHKTGLAGNPYHDRMLLTFDEEPFASFFSYYGDLDIRHFFSKHEGVLALDTEGQQQVESLLLDIASELREKQEGFRFAAMAKLSGLLIYAMRYSAQNESGPAAVLASTPKHKKVAEVASYIVENCAEADSLNTLASRFYVSKSYLSRIFREVTGYTVNEYINIHRIKKARQLLTGSSLNMTEISQELGYDSITYFEKVFKKYTGTSPLKYRKLAR